MSFYQDKKDELEGLIKTLADAKVTFKDDLDKQRVDFVVEKDAMNEELEETKKRIAKEKELLRIENEKNARILTHKEKILDMQRQGVIQMAKERQRGFPWLAKAYDELFAYEQRECFLHLRHKKRPAIRASEIVKEYSLKRREAETKRKIAEYLVNCYEDMCPFLIDIREEELGDIEEVDRELQKEYSAEELEDKTTQFLSKEEYRKLSSIEKNQIALDRYWRRPKSKWQIGKMYERYVGHIYDEMGYDVDYVGIFKGLEDRGRDLIVKKGDEIIVIQCKNWGRFRTIFEKHIFQFFGTVFKYKDENKDKNVRAIFYTTTKLSDLSRRFARELGIELKENFKMDKSYSCIKCNISRKDGTKIYHLPFDQQYDNIVIERDRGEFYCKTIKEAEEVGFRRAWRWREKK